MKDLSNVTGGHSERIDPLSVPRGILSIHEVRYRFAEEFVRSGRVLDVACGAGYGTDILAAAAAFATGVDLAEDAVRFAERNFGRRARFMRADGTHLPFRGGAFDAVVSFETIEHVPEHEAFLDEVSRVLRPGGFFVGSTPFAENTTFRPANPHHFVEFSLGDFRRLLSARFPTVRLFGQRRKQGRLHRLLQQADVFGLRHRIARSVRHRADRLLGTEPFEEMTLGSLEIVEEEFRRATEVIAVCRAGAS